MAMLESDACRAPDLHSSSKSFSDIFSDSKTRRKSGRLEGCCLGMVYCAWFTFYIFHHTGAGVKSNILICRQACTLAMTTQDTELHDLSDDADYAAASQQQGSASMVRSDSNISRASDSEGAELVYVKENVTIHPSQSASERISRKLKLIKQWSSLLCHGFHTKGKTLMLVFQRKIGLFTLKGQCLLQK